MANRKSFTSVLRSFGHNPQPETLEALLKTLVRFQDIESRLRDTQIAFAQLRNACNSIMLPQDPEKLITKVEEIRDAVSVERRKKEEAEKALAQAQSKISELEALIKKLVDTQTRLLEQLGNVVEEQCGPR